MQCPKTPSKHTRLFPDSRTAMREALVRLGVQGRAAVAFGGGHYYLAPNGDYGGNRPEPLYCAIGIALGEYAEWAQHKGHKGAGCLRDILTPIAPDAPSRLDLWSTLMVFHDEIWDAHANTSPEVQLKEWAEVQRDDEESDQVAVRLVEFLEL